LPALNLTGTPDEIAAGLRAHVEAGAEHIIASLDPCSERTVAEFAEAVALFRAG
jgi:alkanesulfonate monooxygenase SsuD/methylene tetrahydromethanopterin reductase-like flavin-dependent oxidoreductase (luciferase family)